MAGLTDASNVDAYQNPVVTTWTTTSNASPTPLNSYIAFSTAGMDTVAITIVTTPGVTGGAITFEVYDGAAWIAVKCARLSTYNTDSTYYTDNTYYTYYPYYPYYTYYTDNAYYAYCPTILHRWQWQYL